MMARNVQNDGDIVPNLCKGRQAWNQADVSGIGRSWGRDVIIDVLGVATYRSTDIREHAT